MEKNKGILLESGTGEVEVLEFVVANKHYAINVIKVKEILQVKNINKVPQVPDSVLGISLIRGDVITLIDMNDVLEGNKSNDVGSKMTLLCEFNKLKVGFCIDQVLGIHRIHWNQLQKPDSLVENSLVIGNINFNEQILMLLDFERIIMNISPSSGITSDKVVDLKDMDRSSVKLVLADDSPMIRKVLTDVLIEAGYTNLKFFDDGLQALTYVNNVYDKKGEQFVQDIHVIITDIEMPQLDGHTFIRKIKDHSSLKKIPCIIFSSLITDELKHKGYAVGANAQVSKPEIGDLINIIDSFAFTLERN